MTTTARMPTALRTPRPTRRTYLTSAVSTTPPAVRMVAIQAWAWADDVPATTNHWVYPVLAIIVTNRHAYSRFADDGRFEVGPDHASMMALGWVYEPDGSGIDFDVLLCSGEFGLCEARLALSCSNCVHEIVLTPWPAEEDAERLAPVIERLRQEAREKVRPGGQA